MASSSAPFATKDSSISADSLRPGRRLYAAGSARQDAPFANDYVPSRDDNGVGNPTQRRSGLRRFGEYDQPEDQKPYAEPIPHYQADMWSKTKGQAIATERYIAPRPQDHGSLFRQDDNMGSDMPRSGKKRYVSRDAHAEAPFSLFMKGAGDSNQEPSSINGQSFGNGRRETVDNPNPSNIKDSPLF